MGWNVSGRKKIADTVIFIFWCPNETREILKLICEMFPGLQLSNFNSIGEKARIFLSAWMGGLGRNPGAWKRPLIGSQLLAELRGWGGGAVRKVPWKKPSVVITGKMMGRSFSTKIWINTIVYKHSTTLSNLLRVLFWEPGIHKPSGWNQWEKDSTK